MDLAEKKGTLQKRKKTREVTSPGPWPLIFIRIEPILIRISYHMLNLLV